jgi:hypothetical protein
MAGRGEFRWVALVSGAFVAAAAPVTVSVERGIQAQVAECQDGTCCVEDKATCVVGSHQVGGYYYKKSGPCTQST